jgi:hypothetical protein
MDRRIVYGNDVYFIVTTGLDPVVHAETTYGLPDRVRQ